jgi:hypothetical protein
VVRRLQARAESGDARIPVRPVETADALLSRLGADLDDSEQALERLLEEATNTLIMGSLVPAIAPPLVRESTRPPPRRTTVPPANTPDPPSPPPDLPTDDVPTGYIWPAHTGRAALRALTGERAGATAGLDASGAVKIALGESVLSTTREQRFESPEAARQALVRAARERAQLGALLAPETVLVAQSSADGSTWLWTVRPQMPTVSALLAAPEAVPVRRRVVAAFGAALVDGLKIEALHGIALDLSPAAFGMRDGVVRYCGELRPTDPERQTASALTDALMGLYAACDDLGPAVEAFESAIAARLTAEEARKVSEAGWKTGWSPRPDMPEALRMTCLRLEEALQRRRQAA